MQFTKEQLLKLSEYYELSDKCLKDPVRSILSANLLSAGIFKAELSEPAVLAVPIASSAGLTFEQKNEFPLLQLNHDKDLEWFKQQK